MNYPSNIIAPEVFAAMAGWEARAESAEKTLLLVRRLADLQSAQIGGMSMLTRVLSGQFDSADDLDLEVCPFCGDIECDGGCGMYDPAGVE